MARQLGSCLGAAPYQLRCCPPLQFLPHLYSGAQLSAAQHCSAGPCALLELPRPLQLPLLVLLAGRGHRRAGVLLKLVNDLLDSRKDGSSERQARTCICHNTPTVAIGAANRGMACICFVSTAPSGWVHPNPPHHPPARLRQVAGQHAGHLQVEADTQADAQQVHVTAEHSGRSRACGGSQESRFEHEHGNCFFGRVRSQGRAAGLAWRRGPSCRQAP